MPEPTIAPKVFLPISFKASSGRQARYIIANFPTTWNCIIAIVIVDIINTKNMNPIIKRIKYRIAQKS